MAGRSKSKASFSFFPAFLLVSEWNSPIQATRYARCWDDTFGLLAQFLQPQRTYEAEQGLNKRSHPEPRAGSGGKSVCLMEFPATCFMLHCTHTLPAYLFSTDVARAG
ncbi:hypothetical protein H112_05501 [Trichophyton rubrum D6]|uniref:Secreted protein n=3 Tax=Trichophyton TaxID=5550 RepID=A0A080WFN6_TRIRC|nr:uncharacterized protein TERG_11970 [Trichophyton rubrum CBS 118892]EZF17059.1 hypothetical protein H100_05518 [Trichophyton rubrum MR850]EZF40556.1 hypothetical protein H102_05486 [Trichophyton rubrum CBS 100081]EZF51132.1 hypothetical protein H103_05509 [Trichophyton rubrum CBS 288.86]EZF61838.1 hypothetical protein H104_05500 [Trichophyton rubrum CBS 289.86]EZF72496.1 hypothetical protein H105_05527 [Trichophyton soudanense CBS 452.61]EZF83073.1 hypothetical protein H110_05508 [Trichophy